MKKYFLSFLFLSISIISVLATVTSFVDDGDTIKKYIKIRLADSTVVQYEIQDVDSIYFENDTIKTPKILGVELSADTLSLYPDSTSQLTHIVLGEDVDQLCTFVSSNEEVAVYNPETQLVTALSVGSTEIIALASDSIHADTCVVIVNELPEILVDSAYFSESELTIERGSSNKYIYLRVAPEDAEVKSVEYSSSNTDLVTISQPSNRSCQLIFSKSNTGTAVITALVNGEKTATCTVTLIEPIVNVTSVSVTPTSVSLKPGETQQLAYTISPSKATNKEVTWSSSATNVATVSSTGLITAKSDGTARIVVTSVDGAHVAQCNVTVKSPVSVKSVNLAKKSLTLNSYESEKLAYTITPSDAENQKVIWRTDDYTIADVSYDGVVTAKNAGTTNIVVTTVDGSYTSTCAVTVNYLAPAVSSLSEVSVTAHTAAATTTLAGNVAEISESGLQYSLNEDFTDSVFVQGEFSTGSTTVDTRATALEAAATYYCRPYIVLSASNDTIFGSATSFTTIDADKYAVAEYVDLGLPSGVKWATWNMGADEIGAYGSYFFWGEPTGDVTQASAYRAPSVDNISGNATYDIATAQWGAGWRLPYKEEFDELFANCTIEWVSDYVVDGQTINATKLTSKINGASIILPRAGYNGGTSGTNRGYYWTAESSNASTGSRLYYDIYTVSSHYSSSFSGATRLSVRPVYGDYVAPKSQEELEHEDRAGETAQAADAVELGVNVRWATCNVGTNNKRPTEYGGYYSWAETEKKTRNTLSTYTLYSDGEYEYIGDSFDGDETYDVARSKWGGKWYTPTKNDWDILIRECTWVWTTNYQNSGVNGYLVYGVGQYSSNFIFLPAAGYNTSIELNQGRNGTYWSSSLYTDKSVPEYYNITAWRLTFTNDSRQTSAFDRYAGYSIRPVKK